MLPQSLLRPYLYRPLLLLAASTVLFADKLASAFPVADYAVNVDSYQLPVAPAELFQFMRRYGYLDSSPIGSESLYSEAAVIGAIKNVQKFGGLAQTGELTNETLQLLISPRCGVPDISSAAGRRRKRFVIGGSGWKKRTITYL